MVERKDMCSSSEKTPKLQLTAGQPSDRKMLDPTKKEKHTPHPRAKKKTQQDSRRGKIAFRLKPHAHQRLPEGSNKILCAPGESTETESDLPLSVSCGGTGQQWPAAGVGDLDAADLGKA